MMYNEKYLDCGRLVNNRANEQKNAQKLSKVKIFLLIFAAICYISVLMTQDIALIIGDTVAGIWAAISINQLMKK